MIDTSEGAGAFARAALETFEKVGASVGALEETEGFEVGSRDMVVLLGVVGAWRGAVAFRFDPEAVRSTSHVMAGEDVDDEDLIFDALLEAVNVVAGRGAASLAEAAGEAVWLTPPLLATGDDLAIRLQNFQGNCYRYPLAGGGGGILFSAAPANGGLS